ncbi:MAG: GAF domain-containing protein [Sulfurimonadaceae bacterium]|jgi:signal transduction protein with GAF and PtsI domain|nr:GAF domain-containing protein [Sulfurimonadaceae bacterium]
MKYEKTYSRLADFGRDLLDKKSLEEGLPMIAKYAKGVIGADRCSIFIHDFKNNQLWTTLADEVEKIVIPADKGVVGYTIKAKKPIIANDAYNNPNFLSEVDKKTGYITENIVTAPVFNSKREIIGVLQLLNKKDGFDNEDVKFMIFFAHYISGFLELINLYNQEQK